MAWLAPWDLGCVIFEEYLFRPGGHPGLTECLGAACCSVAAADDLMSLVEGLFEDALADDATGRMAVARICTIARRGDRVKERKELERGGAEKESRRKLKTSRGERCRLVTKPSIERAPERARERTHFSFLSICSSSTPLPSNNLNLDPPTFPSVRASFVAFTPPILLRHLRETSRGANQRPLISRRSPPPREQG